MKIVVITLALWFLTPEFAAPQDLVITNARILGRAADIDQGTIVVREGRIVSVTADPPDSPASLEIDAGGMTVMSGLIDTHRHLLAYETLRNETELRRYIDRELPAVLRGLLAGGITSVMSPGDLVPEIFAIRKRLEQGDLVGPRLIAAAGPTFTSPDDHPVGSVCRSDPFCGSRLAIEVGDPETARFPKIPGDNH